MIFMQVYQAVRAAVCAGPGTCAQRLPAQSIHSPHAAGPTSTVSRTTLRQRLRCRGTTLSVLACVRALLTTTICTTLHALHKCCAALAGTAVVAYSTRYVVYYHISNYLNMCCVCMKSSWHKASVLCMSCAAVASFISH